jgi:hypothetical protein
MKAKTKTTVFVVALTAGLSVLASGPEDGAEKVRLRLRIPRGLKTEVTASGLLKMALDNRLQAYNQPETSIPDQHTSSWKRKYADTYSVVEGGRPRRIIRHTEADSRTAKSPQSGKMETEDLPTKDSTVTLTLLADGGVELNEDAEPQVVDEFKKIRAATFVADQELAAGEDWTIPEALLKACLPFVDKGAGTLKLAAVEVDPELKQRVASIDGRLNLVYNVPVQEGLVLPISFEGTLKLKILVDTGLEILRKLDGQATLDYRTQQGVVKVQVIGKGEYHELFSTKILEKEKE